MHDDHTSFACSQNQNKWLMVSTCSPHTSHVLSLVMFLRRKFSFVARIFLQAFHAKCLTLFGTFIYHNLFQVCFIGDWFEPSAITVSHSSSCASLYALLTVNRPFLFSVHITLSLAPVTHNGMLRIASVSCGRKHWLTRSLFHSLLSSSIRSLTPSLV